MFLWFSYGLPGGNHHFPWDFRQGGAKPRSARSDSRKPAKRGDSRRRETWQKWPWRLWILGKSWEFGWNMRKWLVDVGWCGLMLVDFWDTLSNKKWGFLLANMVLLSLVWIMLFVSLDSQCHYNVLVYRVDHYLSYCCYCRILPLFLLSIRKMMSKKWRSW